VYHLTAVTSMAAFRVLYSLCYTVSCGWTRWSCE